MQTGNMSAFKDQKMGRRFSDRLDDEWIAFHVCLRYSKCSKISNTFLILFSNTMLIFRAGIHKVLVRIANREDPDQTASSEAV